MSNKASCTPESSEQSFLNSKHDEGCFQFCTEKRMSRRGSHYSHKEPNSTLDDVNNVSNRKFGDEASLVLSILYGLFLVILAIVLKLSESINSPQTKAVKLENIFKTYLCILFFVALLWLSAFKFYTSWWRKKKVSGKIVKSPHASNRWLKGIVAIFGFSVIVKETLEVIGVTEIDNPECQDRLLLSLTAVLHSLFVMGQVIFLFFYAKIHIQDFTYISRFGIMHAMATNLAVWISIIADETSHALMYERLHHNHTTVRKVVAGIRKNSFEDFISALESHCNKTADLHSFLDNYGANDTGYMLQHVDETEGLFKGDCYCHSNVCDLIASADRLLSPLLIEFCLVSSCLLYVTWSNVGKKRKQLHYVTKPNYRFYKSYRGVLMGTSVLLGTVVIMVLLASLDSGIPEDQKRYYSEHEYLLIYETFLVVCNSAILFGCIAGFYVFSILKTTPATHSSVALDVVLLFICLVGPFLVDLFSVLSLVAGRASTKRSGWKVSMASSIMDILVSIVQILLIIHGMNRRPVIQVAKSHATPNGIVKHFEMVNCSKEDKVCEVEASKMEKTLPLNQLKSSDDLSVAETSLSPQDFHKVRILSASACDEETNSIVKETFLSSPEPLDIAASNHRRSFAFPPPHRMRIILRDIIMFLVLSNTCLWILLSLNRTCFRVYTYPSEYFGHSAWTTLTSVTAPLSIFLKLHSAACFFEIWSYS